MTQPPLGISPSQKQREKIGTIAQELIAKLQKHCVQAKVILGGSAAKDTFLAQSTDIDIFVAFNYEAYKEKSSELSNTLEPLIKKTFPKTQIKRLHGSRDYFQLQKGEFTIEIVPILEIAKPRQAKNITDISPLHTAWVNKHAQGLKDEIRKAKAFAKAQRVYGAESFIGGFSGYVLEILIVHAQSFENLLKEAKKWNKKTIIDVANLYPKKDALFHINSSKTLGSLIVIDPVDEQRNAAAALSEQVLKEFRTKASAYLKNPDQEYFVKEPLEEWLKTKKSKQTLLLKVSALEQKRDVAGAKIKKVIEHIRRKLAEFEPKEYKWEFEEQATIALVFAKKTLPREKIVQGPPTKLPESTKAFTQKYKETFQKDGFTYARTERAITNLSAALEKVLQDKYVQERVVSINRVEHPKL